MDSGTVVGIISQSDIVAYLWEHKALLADSTIWHKKVKDFGTDLVHRKVVMASKDSTTLDAFSLIFSKGVNAIAIVDKEGQIVSTLSPSDLKVS
jgi:CBS-domain-containing membrane protein